MTPNGSTDKLYSLLPAIYRERDPAQGEPLRALLRLIQGQADLVEDDIWRLWQNFAIETCDPWVIPYIGDLVANLPLFDASRIRQPDTARQLFPDLAGPRLVPDVALRARADAAKTIYYRRRKGTLPMLEELARDVTGWGAHAVEDFELLGWTQCLRNHLRMHSLRTPDIRQVEPMDRVNGPFDQISHTVDVRPFEPLTGWYNIKHLAFFLWRRGCLVVTDEPDAVLGLIFEGIRLLGVFAPSGSPALIRYSIGVLKDLVVMLSRNPEVEPPVGMMHVRRLAGEPPTLQDRTDFPLLTEVPGMVEMVFADSGVNPHLKPLHPSDRVGLETDFRITGRYGLQMFPGNTVLERSAPPR